MTSLFEVTNDDDLGIDPNIDPVEFLTGPGGKFDKTKYASEAEMWQAIAKSKVESDAFIKIKNTQTDEMRAEAQRLRQENTAKASLQEYIDQMRTLGNTNSSSAQTPANESQVPLYDPKTVKDTIYQTYSEIRQKEQEDANFATVVGKLKERFGDRFQPHLKEKAMELGLNDLAVESMARTMPQVLIRSLGLDQAQPQYVNAPRSSMRLDQFQPKGGLKRDYAYYEKMRKDQPELFNSTKITVQRHKDVLDMGEQAFYGDTYGEE